MKNKIYCWVKLLKFTLLLFIYSKGGYNMIQKRFPAEVSLDIDTFLNDRKIDGELYAIYQSLSMSLKVNGQDTTVLYKKDIPKQVDLCNKLGIKTAKTVRAHRDYLIKKGYLIEQEDYYILPNMEQQYLLIPLKTLQFLNDTLKIQVIKIYIYLGQRWRYKGSEYSFTNAEIGDHIGLDARNQVRDNTTVNNVLKCLKELGLIDYIDYTDMTTGHPISKKRLINYSLEI